MIIRNIINQIILMDYAFIINILFLYEKPPHNKEKVININVESPIIYLNENYLLDIIVF